LITSSSLASTIFATFSHRPKNTTTRSERTYRCRRTRRFGVMCAGQGACVGRRSWAGYTISMFEFEFPTGTTVRPDRRSACQGLTILIVEQNVHNALRTAIRAYVLKNGRIVMQGERPTLLADERLRTAYLGL
jgi:hypothetical protein